MRKALKLASVLVVLSTSALAEMNGVLRIGLVNDMASVYADLGGAGSVLAAQMAVEDFAKQSKRKVQILSADHQNKPDVGAGIARRWFDVEGVDVIVDIPNSAVAPRAAAQEQEAPQAPVGADDAAGRPHERAFPVIIQYVDDKSCLAEVGTATAGFQATNSSE
jgi:branched-chain amino acid transport system substrate-binding protein